MRIGARTGRLSVLACALFAIAMLSTDPVQAAPRAADLGPQVAITEPRDGYVGRLGVEPKHGPVGTPVTVKGEGFAPEQDFELVWRTVQGRWKVTVAEYHGREYTPIAYRIATVRSDKSGRIMASFVAPEDFGFVHDVVIQQSDRLLTQTAFSIDITARVAGA